MCKFFKKIWDFMIQIGNTVISAITVGNSTVTRIDVESTQVYPSVQPSVYINLNPTTVLPWNGYYRTGTITVDSNTNDWQVRAESTPSGSYFTAVKTNNTTVTWTMQANDSRTSRVGYVTVYYGSVSAQTTVYQNAGYVIYIDNQSPAVVNSGATTLAVSVWSKYGNEAVPATYQITGNNWLRYTSMTDAGGGHYIYNFAIDTNTDTQTRYNGITFTQTQGSSTPYKSASLAITQKAMYVPETIAGFERFTYEGDWQLGRYQSGTVEIGGVITPIFVIALLNANSPSATCVANYTITSYTQAGSSAPAYQTNTGPRTISTTNTVDIPNGASSVWGITINGGPNLRITEVTGLEVTAE